ncbi:hypothetical protein D3C77_668900 [compost metagenome]
MAVCRIDPAAAKNQRVAQTGPDRVLTCKFGGAIDILRGWGVGFLIGRGAGAVEHIVSGIVNQQGARVLRVVGQRGDGLGVEQCGLLPMRFRQIHGGIARRIHNDIGLMER